jgi:hypothetical protein
MHFAIKSTVFLLVRNPSVKRGVFSFVRWQIPRGGVMMFGEGWKPSTAGVETKRAQVSLGSLVVFEGPTSTENCSKVI